MGSTTTRQQQYESPYTWSLLCCPLGYYTVVNKGGNRQLNLFSDKVFYLFLNVHQNRLIHINRDYLYKIL